MGFLEEVVFSMVFIQYLFVSIYHVLSTEGLRLSNVYESLFFIFASVPQEPF